MKQLRLSIPEPCKVGWHTMTPVDDNRRHCSSCDRVLTDFSKMSDAELVAFFQKGEKLCGRFSTAQLNRSLIPRERPAQNWKLALLLPSLLFGIKAVAQQTQSAPVAVHQMQTPVASTKAIPAAGDSLWIEGTVTDSATGEPMVAVTVNVKTADSTYRLSSDLDGRFRFQLPSSAEKTVLVDFLYIGYQTATIRATAGTGSLHVVLAPVTPILLEGIMVVETHPESRRHHFFHRLFHWRKR